MAYPREKYSCRQKTCLLLSVFILILGLLQLSLGILFTIKSRNRKCHKSKHMLIGMYLIFSGIFGIVSYCPRKVRNPWTERKIGRSRACTSIFIIFCVLVTIVVGLDTTALNCMVHLEIRSHETTMRLYAILGLVDVTAMHLAHVLCALCIGLSFPDLWSYRKRWLSDSEKMNSLEKQKSKQALHLPAARVHVQEAPGTGDKLTVVSLPENHGIVYAVPEQKYVILRGGSTYMLPPGNTTLTPYFPTIRQTE